MNIQNLIPWTRSSGRLPGQSPGGEQDPFLSLYRDVNRLFDETSRGFGGAMPMLSQGGWPNLEISDNDNEIRVIAEVPGLEANDVEVLLADNVLTLRGERKLENEDNERRFSERYYGRFERRIPLGSEVEPDKVAAEFNNGVLTITLLKSQQAQGNVHRIEVRKKG